MNRKEALHNAEICVCGQREQDYGKPEDGDVGMARNEWWRDEP